MRPVLLIQTGNPPRALRAQYGGFDDMVCSMAGLESAKTRIVRVYAGEEPGPVASYSAAILTGSPANITDKLAWSENTAGWIRDAMDAELPLLGICYGHQLLAHALGGHVDYHPSGRETGTWMMHQTEAGLADEWMQHVPAQFPAQLLHEQAVMQAPAGAVVLARNEHDPHQMLRYGAKAVGMQFHPEFSASVMRSYILLLSEMLAREGADVQALAAAVRETPVATGLMASFLAKYAR